MGFIKRHPIFITIVLAVGGFLYWNYFRGVTINSKIDSKSDQYVNDMYYAEGSAYEKLLDKYEKKMYLKILSDVKKNKQDTKLEGPDYGCDVYTNCDKLLVKVVEALNLDHPELIQWGTYGTVQVGQFLKVEYKYALKSSVETKINNMRLLRMIDDIKKSTKDLTEIEKVKYVYEWMNRSDYDSTFKENSKNQSAYYVFKKKDAMSPAFAKASQIIFQNLGITSYLVNGTKNGEHMWNIVKIDEEYYYFDATNGLNVKKESKDYYSGVGALKDTYKLNHKELYPELNGVKYLYSGN